MKKSNFITIILFALAIMTPAYLIFDHYSTIWKVINQKITKAKQDCDTIAQGAKKIESVDI